MATQGAPGRIVASGNGRRVPPRWQRLVPYRWPRIKDGPALPKLTFATDFKPWGWIIGKGDIVDDLDEAVREIVIASGLKAFCSGPGRLGCGGDCTLDHRPPGPNDRPNAQSGCGRHRQRGGRDPAPGRTRELARSMEIFRANSIENRRLLDQQEELKEAAAKDRKRALQQMADSFEASVMGVVQIVSSSSTQLQVTAQSMSSAATQASAQARTVAAAAEQATSNVQTVAAAAEELSSSISEISRQVPKLRRFPRLLPKKRPAPTQWS